MKAHEALIAFSPPFADTPTAGQMKVGRLLHDYDPDWTRPFLCTGGAAWVYRRNLRGQESLYCLICEMEDLVKFWKMDPRVVHHACLSIAEYKAAKKFYIEGAYGEVD